VSLRTGVGGGDGSAGSGLGGGAAGTIAFVNPVKKIRGTVMVNYFPGEKWPVRADTTKALQTDLARFIQTPWCDQQARQADPVGHP